MVQTFLLFDTITNEKTVKFMQRDIITSSITWHLGLVGSNNFGECTSFSPFTLLVTAAYRTFALPVEKKSLFKLKAFDITMCTYIS